MKKARILYRKNNKKINKKNRDLMIETVLEYSPNLIDGVKKYKSSNRNFFICISLGLLLSNILIFSLPCCVLAIAFLIKMLKYVRYKHIYIIVSKLAKDMVIKGIYDRDRIKIMVKDFQEKHGEDIFEYKQLKYMIWRYDKLINKIQKVINTIPTKDIINEKVYEMEGTKSFMSLNNNVQINEKIEDSVKNKRKGELLTYKDEQGCVKNIKRAIEFFEDEKLEDSTVVLKSKKNGKTSKLTVYLGKKNNVLEQNFIH